MASISFLSSLFRRGHDQIGKLWLLYCKLGAPPLSTFQRPTKFSSGPFGNSSPLLLFLCSLALDTEVPPTSLALCTRPHFFQCEGMKEGRSERGRRGLLSNLFEERYSIKRIKASAPSARTRVHQRGRERETGAPSEKLKCKCVTERASKQSLSFYEELNECDARTTYPCMILRAMEGKKGG